MKYFILISLVLFTGCSSDLRASYSYFPDKIIFVKELDLDLGSSDYEIQNAARAYFDRFGLDLILNYQKRKLDVIGDVKSIKVFEYIFLTMFENEPKVVIDFNYDSKQNGIRLKEKFSVEPYQTKTLKSPRKSQSKYECKVRYSDQIRFTDHAVFDFDFIQFSGGKSQSLSFSSVFKNGEQEAFSFDVSEDSLNCHIEGSVKVNWSYENSHFYTSVTNFIEVDHSREIAVMPIVSGDALEQELRNSMNNNELIVSLQVDNKFISLEKLFEKYLQLFGINIKPEDILIYNKKTYNILLCSSKNNCKRFREIMAPLCFFQEKKIQLEGGFYKENKRISSFQLPVLFNKSTELKSSFLKNLETEFSEDINIGLSFLYNKEFFEDSIFIESGAEYEFFNNKKDILLNKNSIDNLVLGKEKVVLFKEGLKLKLKVSSYKIYE